MNFAINLNGRDLDQSIGSGFSFSAKVKGFWSNDSIYVSINRNLFVDETSEYGFSSKYKISISHSSGGRDTKEIPDDVEAEQYFGEALIGVTKFVREEIQPRLDMWERMYQEERAAERLLMETEKKLKQQKIDRDFAVGVSRAMDVAKKLRSGDYSMLTLYTRGSDDSVLISRIVRPSGQVHFVNQTGSRLTYNELVQSISESSNQRLVTQ